MLSGEEEFLYATETGANLWLESLEDRLEC